MENMDKKAPIDFIWNKLDFKKIIKHTEYCFITSDFGFIDDLIKMESVLFHLGQPYKMHEGRIVQLTSGKARINVNLSEYTLTPGKVLITFPESILQPLEFTPDTRVRVITATPNFIQDAGNEDFFRHYLANDTNTLLPLDKEENEEVDQYFSLFWSILRAPWFKQEVIRQLFMSLLHYIHDLRANNQEESSKHLTRQEEIFQKFIMLVNKNSCTERNVSFYADKLCLTPRYLNTLIRQTSERTVMEWINRSVILEAKVLLKHSNKMIYEIADELNFPSTSFFCKFFKKNTGMTPLEYQKHD